MTSPGCINEALHRLLCPTQETAAGLYKLETVLDASTNVMFTSGPTKCRLTQYAGSRRVCI